MRGSNESKTLSKHISFNFRGEFDGRKCNSKQKRNNCNFQCKCKKPGVAKVSDHVKHQTYNEDYALNPSTCVSRCYKVYEIGENCKHCICMKILVDNLVLMCDKIEKTVDKSELHDARGYINHF